MLMDVRVTTAQSARLGSDSGTQLLSKLSFGSGKYSITSRLCPFAGEQMGLNNHKWVVCLRKAPYQVYNVDETPES